MFEMLDLSMASYSTEKSYTFSFKDTSSKSTYVVDMLPRQN